jgi:hypothetical protein
VCVGCGQVCCAILPTELNKTHFAMVSPRGDFKHCVVGVVSSDDPKASSVMALWLQGRDSDMGVCASRGVYVGVIRPLGSRWTSTTTLTPRVEARLHAAQSWL